MSNTVPGSAARETLKEGAAEVREKLKSDLSHIARFRRGVSLRPTMGCIDCDATGKVPCTGCGGSGQQRLILDDEKAEKCETCQGTGQVTCVTCAGRRFVPNVNRKRVLWLLVVGGLAWAFVLWRLWDRDVLPEYINKGGGGAAAGLRRAAPPTSRAPGVGMRAGQPSYPQPYGSPGVGQPMGPGVRR